MGDLRASSSRFLKLAKLLIELGLERSIELVLSETTFEFHDLLKNKRSRQIIDAVDFRAATDFLIQWLDDQIRLSID